MEFTKKELGEMFLICLAQWGVVLVCIALIAFAGMMIGWPYHAYLSVPKPWCYLLGTLTLVGPASIIFLRRWYRLRRM